MEFVSWDMEFVWDLERREKGNGRGETERRERGNATAGADRDHLVARPRMLGCLVAQRRVETATATIGALSVIQAKAGIQRSSSAALMHYARPDS